MGFCQLGYLPGSSFYNLVFQKCGRSCKTRRGILTLQTKSSPSVSLINVSCFTKNPDFFSLLECFSFDSYIIHTCSL